MTLLNESTYIRVILPLALPKLYTYKVDAAMAGDVEVGKRVEVQFGPRKLYAALVHGFHTDDDIPADVRQVKTILNVLDEHAIVSTWQLQFWEWIAEYYVCTLGEVMQAALPAAFKLESASTFIRHPDAEFNDADLSGDEFVIMEAFDFQEKLSLTDIQAILSRKSVMKVVRSLIGQRLIFIEEALVQRYKPKTERRVSMAPGLDSDADLKNALDQLRRAPKQEALVLAVLDEKFKGSTSVSQKQLLQRTQAGPASLKSLVERGILEIEEVPVDRVEMFESGGEANVLEAGQAKALEQIRNHFRETGGKEVCLLHGITSSGKTHVYVELIKEYVESGRQVLYLLPEIALTSQLIRRLRRWLGDIGVYHSRFNDMERIEIWNKVASGEYKIVVGPRSAMFLPFDDLGLVIADEEHDVSYKQFDPAPRYQARDCAVFLGALHKAKVVLGSATPSFESYYNAKTSKFALVEMHERYGGIQPPRIDIVNLNRARKRKQMHGGFSTELLDAIQEVLSEEGQVILFQNRRGYAPYLTCPECSYIPQCKNCDVGLTYHKFSEDLRCHYCGYRERLVNQCQSCGSFTMEIRGMGTERIEDDLKILLPDARIGRMDWDSVRGKHGHDRIISQLEEGKIDILVGTQMVTKGLDFENVKLVGVMNADALLYFPDFRAVERAFHILMQVSGRSGRKHGQGRVIVQMSDVEHPITRYITDEDPLGYKTLYANEILERQAFKYPPYVRLMKIYLKHKDYKVVDKAALEVTRMLKAEWGARVMGPVKPVIARLRTLYIREITVKMERKQSVMQEMKRSVLKARDELFQFQEFRSLRIYADVDAY